MLIAFTTLLIRFKKYYFLINLRKFEESKFNISFTISEHYKCGSLVTIAFLLNPPSRDKRTLKQLTENWCLLSIFQNFMDNIYYSLDQSTHTHTYAHTRLFWLVTNNSNHCPKRWNNLTFLEIPIFLYK